MSKRFLIHVSTNWCGMDQIYPAIAENESDLEELAEQLAQENFESFDLWTDVAEELGYDPNEMTDEDWDDVLDHSIWDYCSYHIDEFNEDEDDWNNYVHDNGFIYGDV